MVTINKDTGISIAVVALLLSGLAVIIGFCYSIDRRLMAMEFQSGDRWTGQMQVKFARDFEMENREKGLVMPDCEEIQRNLSWRLKVSEAPSGGALAAEP